MTFLEIAHGLRCIYYTPAEARDAGYLETDHFGAPFPRTEQLLLPHWRLSALATGPALGASGRDPALAPVPRAAAGHSTSPAAPAMELSAFLEIDAPDGGHDPRALRAEHAQRFLADQRNRHRHGLKSLGMVRAGGQPSLVTDGTSRASSTTAAGSCSWALETGHAGQIGLDRGFITAFPAAGGRSPRRSRSPFTDDVTRALADEASLPRAGQARPQRQRAARCLGGDRLHRAALQRDPQAEGGLHRPLPWPADALARPDQGRKL